jgi:hypothetical protein
VRNLLDKPQNPSLVGFLQALGVTIYCVLISGFFFLMEEMSAKPGYFGIVLMLILLVFSAAVTGMLVFGYPVYLAMNSRIKEAVRVLVYTLLYGLAITIILIFSVIITTT